MAIIPAAVTSQARDEWPKMFGGLTAFNKIAKFRIGEGGWIYNPAILAREPRIPDQNLTDLDIIQDQSRLLIDKRYNVGENLGYFEKNLILSDFSFTPRTLEVSCVLLNVEYNTKNAGTLIYDVGGPYTSPELWEIALLDDDDLMVAYGTFPKQIKMGQFLENVVRITF